MVHSDTIAAVSTPVGEGGISILRLSGPHSQAILEALFSPLPDLFTPFHLYLGMIREPETGNPLDQVLVVRMEAGHSYTREEMAEIHCHGGRLVTGEILRLLLDQGARLAEPGEFTRRAFLSGRIDLVQAESVADLIAAGNEQAVQAAIRQLAGGLSGQLIILEQCLSRQLAALEVEFDLLEEEGLSFSSQSMVDELNVLQEQVKQLVSSYEEGRTLVDGLRVVMVGRPNVGKSSLLNALLGRERSIVTEIPGTTRDVVSERLALGGMTVEIADTAGICQPTDEVERLGVARTDEWMKMADIVIMVMDNTRIPTAEDLLIYQRLIAQRHLVVVNKKDLPAAAGEKQLKEFFDGDIPFIYTTARKDQVDISELKMKLREIIEEDFKNFSGEQVICHLRHKILLEKVLGYLQHSLQLLSTSRPLLDMVAEELQQARLALREITGQQWDGDLLDTIFANFCVGK